MSGWGRKQYSKAWPSRTHVWTWTAILLTGVFFVGVFYLDYWHGWTAAERLYLTDYLRSGVRSKMLPAATSKYTLLEGVNAKGQEVLLLGDEIEQVTGPDGRPRWRLTDAGVHDGLVRLQWVAGPFSSPCMLRILTRGS